MKMEMLKNAKQQHSITKRTFIDEKEVAAVYGVAVQTVRNWRHQRLPPTYYKINRMVRYDYDQVIEYMESHRVELDKDKSN